MQGDRAYWIQGRKCTDVERRGQHQNGNRSHEVEHHLEYSALHEQYLSEFETNLSEFLTGEGCSSAEFFSQCQDALDDKYVALFDEHEHHWFVDALHASLSYERFFTLMIDECRKQHQQHK